MAAREHIIFDRDLYGTLGAGEFGVSLSNGTIAFGIGNSTEQQHSSAVPTNVADGIWHHIASDESRLVGWLGSDLCGWPARR